MEIRNIAPCAIPPPYLAASAAMKRDRGGREPIARDPVFCEPVRMGNAQTDWLLATLQLPHIVTVPHRPLPSEQEQPGREDRRAGTCDDVPMNNSEVPPTVLSDDITALLATAKVRLEKPQQQQLEEIALVDDPNEIELD